jgi:branched-chain amino acid transport system substrate-binding protein
VAGYGVALVALNDDDDPDKAARQTLKMDVDEDVVGVIGPLSRATARAAARPLTEAALPWIAPCSVADSIVSGHQGSFRLYASDIALAEAAAGQALAIESLSGREPLAVGSVGEFARPLREIAERLKVYQPLETMSNGPSSPVLLGGDAEQAAEDLILLGGTQGMVVAGPEAGRAVLVQRAAGTAEGLVWVGSLSPADPSTLPESFIDGYQELAGGPPGPFAVLAYDATNLLLDAIDLDITQNGTPTRLGVQATLSAVRREGLSGRLEFDAQGSWLNAPVYAYRVAGDDLFAERLPVATLE